MNCDSPKIIECSGLTVVRGGKKIFSDVSFDVPAGCSTAILGPNGAGKSTLLKLVTRELYPAATAKGSLKLFGEIPNLSLNARLNAN